MRVVVISPLSFQIGGGGEHTFIDLGRTLRSQGHEVTLAQIDSAFGSIRRISKGRMTQVAEDLPLVTLPPLKVAGKELPLPSMSGMTRLVRLLREADLVVLGGYYGSDILVRLLAGANGVPVLASLGNSLQRNDRVVVRDVAQHVYNNTLGLWLARHYAGVRVCNSEDEAYLRKRGVKNISLLYPGDIPRAASSESPQTQRPSAVGTPLRVLVAGRMSHQKGVDVIERIVEEVAAEGASHGSRFKFIFVGVPDLPKRLTELQISKPELIENMGVLPRTGVLDLMEEVDILLMPSRYESFGIVAMEAQSKGVPVLGSDIVGLREIVKDRETGYLVKGWKPGDYVRILHEVESLRTQDPSHWASIREAAQHRFQTVFSGPSAQKRLGRFLEFAEALAKNPSEVGPAKSQPRASQGVLSMNGRTSSGLKVLLLSPLALEVGGGGEQDFIELARELRGRGAEVTVAQLDLAYRSVRRMTPSELSSRLAGAVLVRLPPLSIAQGILPLPSLRALSHTATLMRNADVVILGTYYGSDMIFQLIAKINGPSLVCSQGNALQRYDRVLFRDILQLLYNRTVGLMVLQHSDGVRVWNREDQSWLRSHGQPHAFVLYPTANLNYPLRSPEPEPALEAGPQVLKVLVAGRMTPQKGVDIVEGIVRDLVEKGLDISKRFKFIFVGTPSLPGTLEQVLKSHPELVANLGIQPRSELVRLMGHVDVLLMPSRYESFGMVAMEAQSQGTPIIGSNIVGLRDVAVDGQTGFLIDGWDPHLYVDRLLQIQRMKVEDPAGWTALRKATAARYEATFSPIRHLEQLDKFIEFAWSLPRSHRSHG